MNAQKQNIIGTCAGFLLALMAGASAVADDTELLLATPTTTGANRPNIMFIIDTSTSMDSTEETPNPYDPAVEYDGDCKRDRIYWMDVDGIEPDCNTSEQSIKKENFFCDAASTQMNGLGSYAGVMAQYRDGGRDGTGSGPEKWQFLARDYKSEPVECQADAGVHGDGRPGYLWALAGSNNADPFTNDPGTQVNWGGAPRNQSYTVYDGNYLNWDANPVIIQLERIDIVKNVLTTLFQSITGVNVGVERFNDDEGGTIIQAMINLDTRDRKSVV